MRPSFLQSLFLHYVSASRAKASEPPKPMWLWLLWSLGTSAFWRKSSLTVLMDVDNILASLLSKTSSPEFLPTSSLSLLRSAQGNPNDKLISSLLQNLSKWRLRNDSPRGPGQRTLHFLKSKFFLMASL